ncbi:MAG: 3'-5' exonuclease domain-containing protein 2 [Dysgonamonadaceae bacterium]|nr:3'-5' exonuclease domain-containing protein 2 [Dysgonamonadaceae bacterium]
MGKTITKEEISGFSAEEFTGRIYVADNPVDSEKAVHYLSRFERLGFDTETRPSFTKGLHRSVSLVQLSTFDACFLFRLTGGGFPPALINLLSNPEILKIGLSLRDDFLSMSRRMKFSPRGFVDLQQIVRNYDIEDLSLQKIYAILFGKKISKNQRLTNWEAKELTEPQKKYAALDAWACLKIYEYLCPTKKYI